MPTIYSYSKVIVASLPIWLCSCFRETFITDIKIAIAPIPVVYGLFTPVADSLQVNVRWGFPVGSNNSLTNDAIDNAQVWLINEAKKDSVRLFYRRAGVYSVPQKNFPIQNGSSYLLKVFIINQKLLSGRFSVPARAAKFDKIEYDKAKKDSNSDYWERDAVKYWYDISSGSNAYYYYTADKAFGDVVNLNQAEYLQKINDLFWTKHSVSSRDKDFRNTFYLITTEKSVYDFLTAASITKEIISPGKTGLLTSFKGILPEYSNISNGLGFVGGYVLSDTTIFLHD